MLVTQIIDFNLIFKLAKFLIPKTVNLKLHTI